MADKEPHLFRIGLDGKTLHCITAASEDALRAIGPGGMVKAEIIKTRGNIRRLAWYWVMLKIALANLADAFDGPVTTRTLHRWLKREAGLAKPIRSIKTGEIMDYDYDSISFDRMPENERAEFIDFASDKLAARLGCDPMTLADEARRAA